MPAHARDRAEHAIHWSAWWVGSRGGATLGMATDSSGVDLVRYFVEFPAHSRHRRRYTRANPPLGRT